MNQAIVDGINSRVQENDTLFFLGDWSFAGAANIWNFRKRIICKNIHFILGNHDHHIENEMRYLPNVRRSEPYSSNFVDGEPIAGEYPDYVSGKELFTSVEHYLRLSIDGQEIVLSHFPMVSWEHSYKGAWMLHGHCHGTLFTQTGKQWAGDSYWYTSAKILDVGIDNIFKMTGEYKPLSFQEIRKIMNKRQVTFTDHHDQKTIG